MKLFRPSAIFATEGIDSQNDGFGERLESIITILVSDIEQDKVTETAIRNHPCLKELEKAISSRIGMKVDLIVNENLAAILPFYSNTSHIFINECFRGNFNIREQTKLLKTFDEKKGTVNLQTAKLTGIFSVYDHPLYMNFWELVKQYKLTAGEITATILHELGHGFYACYYADRTDRTNQVLANVARALVGEEKGDIEYIYREIQKVSPSVTKASVDKMVHGSRTVAGATWFKLVVGMVNSQTMDDTYNETAFEQQADAFASRFGYGKQLILGLDKLSGFTPEKSRALLVLSQMSMAMGTIFLACLVFAALAAGSIFGALIFSFYTTLLLTLSREDVADYTYDKLKFRYIRMRQDVIDQLKNIKLDKKRVKDLLEQIYAMDLCIKETALVKTLPAVVANFIFSGAREADKSITDQQLLESLASNDLFLHAAELRATA